MPVQYQDKTALADNHMAAYVRCIDEDGGKGIRGCLFLITSRGEPMDYCFSRIDVNASFLWRSGEARRSAVASLLKVLFDAINRTPILVLTLADEIPPMVFSDDLLVEVPVCRMSTGDLAIQGTSEQMETLDSSINVIWASSPPEEESPARTLLESLQATHILLEPFERALAGLDEAYK